MALPPPLLPWEISLFPWIQAYPNKERWKLQLSFAYPVSSIWIKSVHASISSEVRINSLLDWATPGMFGWGFSLKALLSFLLSRFLSPNLKLCICFCCSRLYSWMCCLLTVLLCSRLLANNMLDFLAHESDDQILHPFCYHSICTDL